MSEPDEKIEAEEEGGEEYFIAPSEPVILSDGDSTLAIPDLAEFCEVMSAYAVQYWQGKTFVLDKETKQYVEVGAPPAKQKPKLVQ